MTGGASPASPTILVATRNAGKLRELRALFAGAGRDATFVDLAELGLAETSDEDALENDPTFEGNALAKARHFHRLSGLPTVADDSGLAVDALGGAPGVHSKRYSGVTGDSRTVDLANNARLMSALEGADDRRARFVCAAAYVDSAREVVTRGEAPGQLLTEPRGIGGFGYDPYFLADELRQTFAEATVASKETVSHRGRAFRALLAALAEPGLTGPGTVDGPDGVG